MTAKVLQKRNGKSENLQVLQTEDLSYYVESSEGKILYNVILTDEEVSCTCGDWARNSKRDPNFRCKHVLSVLNCIPNGQVEGAHFLDRKKPRLDDRWIIKIENKDFVQYAGLLDLGQGAQFTSNGFTQILKDHEIAISMDGRGRCQDNIFVERLWWTIKHHYLYVDLFSGLRDYDFYSYDRFATEDRVVDHSLFSFTVARE